MTTPATTPPPRDPWYRRFGAQVGVGIAFLLVIAMVTAFAWPGWARGHDVQMNEPPVSADGSSSSSSTSSSPSSTSSSPSNSITEPASPSTTSSSSSGPTAGEAEVGNKDGTKEMVPFLAGYTITNGDTRDIAQMPPVSGLLPNCNTFESWQDVVNCVSSNHAEWYVDGIDRLYKAGEIQFNWATIEKWSLARTVNGNVPEARVIQVIGFSKTEMPESEARAGVADLVGGQEVANNLKVVYLPAGFLNTWRTKGDDPGMTRFLDRNRQVRVSLTPLVLNEKGQVIGLLKDARSGIFVDCFNVHGMFFRPPVETTGTTPVRTTGSTPPPSTTGTPPPTTSTPKCPPGWSGKPPNCLQPKSSNPTDYKRPGDDNSRDAGIGTKPKVTANSTADSRPPVVTTRQTEPNGIVDDSTNQPGSEVGVVAPGATATSTSRYIPPVESGVNPTTSSSSQPPANTGDPGVPQW